MANRAEHKKVLATGWILALTALLGTGVMVLAHWHSQPYITENLRQTKLRLLNEVIDAAAYDNDLLNDTLAVTDVQWLGSAAPSEVYRARRGGRPVAVALTAVAPDGYTGPIRLLIAVDYDGVVSGVRVIEHQETPGLGDAIEIERSDWIAGFTGKSRANPTDAGWKVKRDGGAFDQFTGATITPRAVVAAVHKALRYVEDHRDQLFGVPPQGPAHEPAAVAGPVRRAESGVMP